MSASESSLPREILEAPFPQELIKTRPGAFGGNLSYLEGHTIIARLNEAFDAAWSFEIVSHQILDEEVLVLAKVRADASGTVKMAFGSSRITRDKKGDATAVGDDLKAAATDALKKAATLLGVGLHLYGVQNGATADDDGPFSDASTSAASSPRTGNGDRQVVPFKTTRAAGDGQADGGAGDSGSARITNKQISAIFAIARDRRMSNQQVRDLAKEIFNKTLDYLSKTEGSAMIEHLLAR